MTYFSTLGISAWWPWTHGYFIHVYAVGIYRRETYTQASRGTAFLRLRQIGKSPAWGDAGKHDALGADSGISWSQKSEESYVFCVQAMSLAFGAFGNPRK